VQGGIDDVLRCVQYPVVPGAMKGKNVVVCGVVGSLVQCGGVVACGVVWGVLCGVQSVFNVRHRKCKLGIIITFFRHRVYSHASVTPSLILFCSLWLNSLGKSGLQGAMTQ